MPYPKKKNLTSNMDGTFSAAPKETYKRKKVEYNTAIIDDYRYRRDMVSLQDMFTPEETKDKIREIWNVGKQ